MSDIQVLAARVVENASIFARELKESGIDHYTFEDEHAPIDLPLLSPGGSDAQSALISAAEQILRLARGPLGHLNSYSMTAVEIGTIRALVKLGIPSYIPLGASRSYQHLADQANVSVEILQRLVRFSRVCGFLDEDGDAGVRHNSVSAIFVRNEQAAGGAFWNLEVPVHAATKMYEALQLDPLGQDPRACPASLSYETGKMRPNLWDIHKQFPTLDKRFHDLMASICSSSLESLEHVVRGVDWAALNSVVDVGGSLGHASQAIGAQYPHIKCIVQDSKEAIAKGTPTGNVSFMEYDFFTPQTVVADAYFYRFIIHDWSDEDAKRILAALGPAWHPGARLIIMDTVAPAPRTVDLHVEKYIRGLDVQMYALLAGKERTLGQFQALVYDVEPRLRFSSCTRPQGSVMSLITWIYQG